MENQIKAPNIGGPDCRLDPVMEPKAAVPQFREYLALAGVGSLGLALLYVSGFFVRIGEAYLLGVFIPPSSPLDYLRSGGVFVFQTLDSIRQIFYVSSAPPWLEGTRPAVYLLLLLGMLVALGLASSRPVDRLLARMPRLVRTRVTKRRVSLVVVALFSFFWLHVVSLPYAYKDLLFPLESVHLAERNEKFALLKSSIDSIPALGAASKTRQKLSAQRSILKDELDAQAASGHPDLKTSLEALRDWRALPQPVRASSFGVFALTCLLSIAHLAVSASHLLSRQSRHQGLRVALAFLCGLAGLLQLCALPLTFGMVVQNQSLPLVEVTAPDLAKVENSQMILLGQTQERIYLYDYRDLWTLHVLASDKVNELKIHGREQALAWIDDLYERQWTYEP